MTQPRKAVHCYMADDVYHSIRDVADEHGLTITGLVSGLGSHIDVLVANHPEVIRTAREVDIRSRRRLGIVHRNGADR